MKRLLAFILIAFLSVLSLADARITINNGSTINVDGASFSFPATGGTIARTSDVTSGGLTLLEHHSCSNCSDFHFTSFDTSYRQYKLVFIQVVPTASDETLQLRFSQNGGSSYDSSSNYYWVNSTARNTTTLVGGGTATDTSIHFNQSSAGYYIANGVYGYSGEATIYRSTDNTRPRLTYQGVYFDNVLTYLTTSTGSGWYGVTGNFNAFQIFFNGTTTSGEVYLYGVSTPN